MGNHYWQTAFMPANTHCKRPAQWLALHFPQLAETDEPLVLECLQRLAAWCYQYSSQVCLAPQRNALLLEVAASHKLFGDAETLATRIRTELQQLGYHPASGIAPTPEAAHLAARHGLHIRSNKHIHKDIGALAIDSLYLQPAQIRALQNTGLRSIAEIFRLPRKALARRLGPAVSDYLDRLLGHRPDPCKTYRPADSFSAGTDIAETSNTQGLIFPLNRLVQELCGVLRARDRGIQVLEVSFQIAENKESIGLTLHQATRSEAHLMMLLRERLERLQLPGPVRHIHLAAARFLPFVVVQQGLLPETQQPSAAATGLVIERLQARLGTDAVKGLNCQQDHRPEYSWSLRELDEPTAYTELPRRPAWLLAKPEPCKVNQYSILAGPERIESGWWDGNDCRRDYFVARDTDGSTQWIFREYKPKSGWYRHGLFA
jgi:protein ImuB